MKQMKRMHGNAGKARLAVGCLTAALSFATLAKAPPFATPAHARIFDDTGAPAIFEPELEAALERARWERAATAATTNARTDVGIVLHVLSGPLGEGDLDDEVIARQLAVVNDAFDGAGFRFVVAAVHRHPDSPYFAGGCFPTTESGLRMKAELAIEPKRFVNVYSCRLALPYIAGYGTLPNEFAEDDPRHGVVIDHASVPGSPAPLSLGHTLVHELGHYFGLLHTFQGGCVVPGDEIADTPAEAIAGYGCASGRDSCPQDDGEDPVDNFMDYSDDTCTNRFTPQQGERMSALAAIYRPGLFTPVDAPTPPRAHSSHRRP
jgi:hypothetical protein